MVLSTSRWLRWLFDATPLLGVVLATTGAACNSGGPARELPPEAAAGQRVFQRLGCNACHSFENRVMPGPPLRNIYGKEVKLLDGTTMVRDDAYLKRSILDPGAQTVDGYRPTMVGYGPMLQPGELDQLLALIRFHTGSTE
jgi:cytochrome c oxidase subunit 2